ncbi:hypothetical protein BDL97_07G036700 [Sphagnum fallax]|nr:hypothetical protein BDL97_07G036700 [Sphagnum fallax]
MKVMTLHYTVGFFDLLCCVLSGPFFSVSNKWVVVSVLPPGWWLLHMATLDFVIVRNNPPEHVTPLEANALICGHKGKNEEKGWAWYAFAEFVQN